MRRRPLWFRGGAGHVEIPICPLPVKVEFGLVKATPFQPSKKNWFLSDRAALKGAGLV